MRRYLLRVPIGYRMIVFYTSYRHVHVKKIP